MTRSFSTLVIGFELAVRAASGAAVTAPAGVDALLDRAGKRVVEFGDQFSAVSCTETLQQTKLGPNGKVLVQRSSVFDYLVLLQLNGDDMTVDESRLLQGQPKKQSDRPLLSTTGFSALLLIFHPVFQGSYEFTLGGLEEAGGRQLRQVRFAHIHGHRSPSVLQLRGRDYPLEWEGVAWIDPQTGYVSRISAGLKTSLDDVGLKRLASDVQYTPVRFSGENKTAWLPETALIEANTEHQHWRNVHTFSRYRQFSVSTESKTEAPKQQEEPKQ